MKLTRADIVYQIRTVLRGAINWEQAEELYDSLRLHGLIVDSPDGPTLPAGTDLAAEYSEYLRH